MPSENQNRPPATRRTLLLPMVRALLLLFFGRHSKSLEIIKITSLQARARSRFVKIGKIDVLVARVWATSAKRMRPEHGEYACSSSLCFIFSTENKDLRHARAMSMTFPLANRNSLGFCVNANVLLQVDAAYDCLASTAANGLLQVDAASDYSAPISHCRGGMGEAQGDPPRQPE